MAQRKQYGTYLWNSSEKIPVRSEHRFKRRCSAVSTAASDSDSDSSDPSTATETATSESVASSSHLGSLQSSSPREEGGQVIHDSVGAEPPSSLRDQNLVSDDDASSYSSESDGEAAASEGIIPDRNTELDEPLYPGSKLRISESLLLVMAHSLRHGSSKEATESLLQLIDAHLPEGTVYPQTKHLFFRHFAGHENHRRKHLYCVTCRAYLCELSDQEDVSCDHCKAQHKVKDLLRASSFFLSLDLEGQLRGLLEEKALQPTKRSPAYDVADITESLEYHKLPIAPMDITLTFNTDGVPLYESSSFSIWPLLAQVNELPYRVRVNRLLMAALWFGTGKPAMNTFFVPFIKTMNHLSSTGLLWKDEYGNENVTKVFPGPCTVDTVARCEVMNMTQFNGAHGCAWCEEKGIVVKKGNGHTRAYPATATTSTLRTHESFVKHATMATAKQEPSCGVKGSSILTLMAFFTFSSSFVVDYMHAVCSGFVRATTFMWLNSKRCKKFLLRKNIGDADRLLMSLCPIWETSRLPRSLRETKLWKSADWRNWLLFYSPVVLREYIPQRYYSHWMKFVEIMHYLLAEAVSMEKLNEIKKEMITFVCEYEALYGIKNMSYNTHLLVHMVDSVKHWGPLWGFSLYPFEAMNGLWGRFVKGTRYAHLQITEKFEIMQALPKLWQSSLPLRRSTEVHNVFRTLIKGYRLKKRFSSHGKVTCFGKRELRADGEHLCKMLVGAFRYCVGGLDKSNRKNSYVVAEHMFGRIRTIIATCPNQHEKCECTRNVAVIIDVLRPIQKVIGRSGGTSSFQFVQVESTGETAKVPAVSLKKCLCLHDTCSTFLCAVTEKLVFEAV